MHDAHGRWVANCDFVWWRQRVIVEYDGEHHRDRQQWSNDHLRRRDLAALGWRVIVLTAADLSSKPCVERFLAELRTALDAGASTYG